MNKPPIRTIKLPASAWRRTWLVSAARDFLPPVDFRALLREIAPARWRRMPAGSRSMIGCYRELLRHLDARFPVDPMAFEHIEEGLSNYGDMSIWWDGIPIDVCGVEEEDDYHAPATAVCVAYSVASSGGILGGLGANEAMAPFAGQFAEWFRPGNREIGVRTLESPGRGRSWVSPWDGLGALYAWATNNTGYGWLDASPLNMYETDDWPSWNADEIRAIDASWRECRPIYQRATRLQEHIDRNPNRNVPLLAGALRGDRDILRLLSRNTR